MKTLLDFIIGNDYNTANTHNKGVCFVQQHITV